MKLLRIPFRSVMPPSVRRWIWGLIGIAHLPALAGAWWGFLSRQAGPGDFAGCVALTLTVVFVLLKMCDVRMLRFKATRQSCVAFCVVVLLIHADVLSPASEPSIVPECTTAVATAWLVSSLKPIRQRVQQLLVLSRSPVRRPAPALSFADTLWLDSFHPHCWTRALGLFRLRAPPV